MFFAIGQYLRGKDFEGALGILPPPLGNQNGPLKNQFFERLNLGCQCFLISVDTYEENISTWFGGTTSPRGPK